MTPSALLHWLLFRTARTSISGRAWEERHRPVWGALHSLIDAVTYEGHCEDAARWHAARRHKAPE